LGTKQAERFSPLGCFIGYWQLKRETLKGLVNKGRRFENVDGNNSKILRLRTMWSMCNTISHVNSYRLFKQLKEQL